MADGFSSDAECYNAGMGEQQKATAGQFALWRLFWWVTFVTVTLAIFKADGFWGVLPGSLMVVLLVSKLWLDETGR